VTAEKRITAALEYLYTLHLPFLEVLHDASIDLLEHLKVFSLTKHDVGLSEEEKCYT
jgi:hypothetical protein